MDDLATQDTPGTAPAQQSPAPWQAEIEKLRQENENRVKGFQRLLAERDTRTQALEQELRQLKTAGMSEDEREQQEFAELKERLAQAEAENALLTLAREYPEEFELFNRIRTGSSAKDQLEAIRALRAELRAPASSQSDDEPDEDMEVPDDMPINPRRTTSTVALRDGEWQGSEEDADRMLRSVRRLRDAR